MNNQDKKDPGARTADKAAERPTEIVGLDARLKKVVPEEAQVVGFLLAGDGQQPGRVFPLARNSTLIGRSDSADIRLAHAAVSGEHARITSAGLGFEIEDLGSVNGTFINGQRITGKTKLGRGDRLMLGNLEFTFLVEKSRDSKAALLAPGQRATAVLSNLRPAGLRPATGDDEQGMSFGEMVRSTVNVWTFVKQHLRLVLSLAAVGGAIGAVSAVLLPAPSTAVAAARLDQKRKLNPLKETDGRASDAEAEFFIDPERSFVAPALVKGSLVVIGKEGVSDDGVGEVSDRLEMKSDGERIWKATYKAPLLAGAGAPDPVKFLAAHLDNYVQSDIARGLAKLESETKYLTERMNNTQAEVNQANSALATYKQEHADELPELYISAQTALVTLENRRGDLLAARARLEGQLSELELGGPGQEAEGVSTRNAIIKAEQSLAELRARGLGDVHPDVIKVKEEIAQLQGVQDRILKGDDKVLATGNISDVARRSRKAQLSAELKSTNIQLQDTDRALEKARNTVKNSATVGGRLVVLQNEYDTKKRLLDQFQAQANKASAQLDLEKVAARTRWEILTPARLSNAGVAKTFGLRIGLGLGIAVALAALITLLREARKHVQPAQSHTSSALVPRI
jgi:pSer/pThr/pTyr-binding forkhead associated (FHA) protein/uncharacterized protein involved in exopolysaccharide biosynthesis